MRVNPTLLLVGLLLLLSGSITAGVASSEPESTPQVPLSLRSADPSTSGEWVAWERAFEGAEIHWELFSEGARERLEGLVHSALNPGTQGPWDLQLDDCLAVSRVFVPPRNDGRVYGPMEDLVRTSNAVVSGRVVDQRQGFHNGIPKTLYLLEPLESLKSPDDEGMEEVLFFYPYARIPYRSGSLCGAGPRFPDHPQIGDRVLLFISRSESIGGTEVVIADDPEVFFASPGEALSAPAHFPRSVQSGELLFDEIVEEVKRVAESASAPRRPTRQEERP